MDKIATKSGVLSKVYKELCKLDKKTISFIRKGTNISLCLLAFGTLLSVLNKFVYNYNTYREFIATSMVKSSFTILAEIIIGCILIDSAFKN